MNNINTASLLGIIVVQLLDDSLSVLDYLGIISRGLLSEGVNDASDAHIFKDLSAFLVDTQISNTEESNPPWAL